MTRNRASGWRAESSGPQARCIEEHGIDPPKRWSSCVGGDGVLPSAPGASKIARQPLYPSRNEVSGDNAFDLPPECDALAPGSGARVVEPGVRWQVGKPGQQCLRWILNNECAGRIPWKIGGPNAIDCEAGTERRGLYSDPRRLPPVLELLQALPRRLQHQSWTRVVPAQKLLGFSLPPSLQPALDQPRRMRVLTRESVDCVTVLTSGRSLGRRTGEATQHRIDEASSAHAADGSGERDTGIHGRVLGDPVEGSELKRAEPEHLAEVRSYTSPPARDER